MGISHGLKLEMGIVCCDIVFTLVKNWKGFYVNHGFCQTDGFTVVNLLTKLHGGHIQPIPVH